MQLKKSSIVWLLFLNFAVEATSSSLTSHAVTTNVAGLPVSQTIALEHPEKRAAAAPAAAAPAAAAPAQGGVAQGAGAPGAGAPAGAGAPDTTITTSSSTTGSSTSGASSKGGTLTDQTTRPDPSLSKYTPPPATPVTTLSMDTLATMTEMKDGKTKVYTTTREHTSNLWVTVTKDGKQTVVQTTFAQKFTKQYDKIATPKQGSIGLGSIKGRVGVVKSAMKYTLSSSNGVVPQFVNDGSMFFSLVAFLMWFL